MPCIEISPDGLMCKEVSGLRAGLDFSVGKDLFDLTKWKRILGTGVFVHDLINGYIDADGATYIYDDLTNPEMSNVMVSAEMWYNDCNDRLPGVVIDAKASDGTTFLHNMTSCSGSAPRMVTGARVSGTDINTLNVVAASPGVWHWKSITAQDLSGPDDVEIWGSDNDSNWSNRMLARFFMSAGQLATIRNRTGKGGMRVWLIGFGAPLARFRRYREYGSVEAGNSIIVKDVPDQRKIVIVRDVGLHSAASISLTNTSGAPATLTFSHEAFPVPPSTKLLGPMTRLELRTIPDVLVGTFTPIKRSATDIDGINWGDVYSAAGSFPPIPGSGGTCPIPDSGKDITYPGCQGGIDVTYTGCQDGSANPICP